MHCWMDGCVVAWICVPAHLSTIRVQEMDVEMSSLKRDVNRKSHEYQKFGVQGDLRAGSR